MEDRFGTDIGDLWSAVTDPGRLARWIGEVEGDLRRAVSSAFASLPADRKAPGRWTRASPAAAAADDPRRRSSAGSAARGGKTILVWAERGLPVDLLAAYGAGVQIHVEDLAAYLAGRDRVDAATRWRELQPAYEALASRLG
jgi:hypothetical protein